MAPQPAETCCLSCSLLQGVQVIASYTVVVGSFSMLSILVGGPKNTETQSVALTTVDFLQTMVHTLALFAGFKGLIGVLLRDAHRLRVLLLYHVCELLMSCLALIVRLAKGCQQLEHLQKLHKTKLKLDCSSLQASLILEFAIHAALIAYFAFIIWSLATRLEAGELGQPSLFGDQEMADRTGTLGDPWLFLQPPGSETSSILFQQRAPLSGVRAGGAGSAGPTPFSGAPRNLDDQQATSSPEPFSGTPYRLE
eukprot:gb/GFBE01078838.1/.p1 GENE.gb/GFBE01078838.1/~~gb/GFBE01078838.1/.p1  ORF type:complete len:253 (+),score=44.73 gb/GFBE01078838.1/:1-759(+)